LAIIASMIGVTFELTDFCCKMKLNGSLYE